MDRRLQFQTLLGTLGAKKVYFQAPAQELMEYPCILYAVDDEDAQFADNEAYSLTRGYQVTVIDRDPTSEIPGKVARLRHSKFQRFFVVDGLNHTIYKTFF